MLLRRRRAGRSASYGASLRLITGGASRDGVSCATGNIWDSVLVRDKVQYDLPLPIGRVVVCAVHSRENVDASMESHVTAVLDRAEPARASILRFTECGAVVHLQVRMYGAMCFDLGELSVSQLDRIVGFGASIEVCGSEAATWRALWERLERLDI